MVSRTSRGNRTWNLHVLFISLSLINIGARFTSNGHVLYHGTPNILGAAAAGAADGRIHLQQVDYRFTVRDFMWAGCLNSSTLANVWPGTKKSHKGIAHRSYEQTMDEEDFHANCPLWRDMQEGRVMAHPDFEVDSRYQAMGTTGVGKSFQTPVLLDGAPVEHAPRWHCNLADILEPTLSVDSAGLSKPKFVSRGRCNNVTSSQLNESSVSGAEYFEQW
jgi:hypothetical protein